MRKVQRVQGRLANIGVGITGMGAKECIDGVQGFIGRGKAAFIENTFNSARLFVGYVGELIGYRDGNGKKPHPDEILSQGLQGGVDIGGFVVGVGIYKLGRLVLQGLFQDCKN